MIEAPTTASGRAAVKRAHQARAEALREGWNWLFGIKR